jgi:hypothetical protein
MLASLLNFCGRKFPATINFNLSANSFAVHRDLTRHLCQLPVSPSILARPRNWNTSARHQTPSVLVLHLAIASPNACVCSLLHRTPPRTSSLAVPNPGNTTLSASRRRRQDWMYLRETKLQHAKNTWQQVAGSGTKHAFRMYASQHANVADTRVHRFFKQVSHSSLQN